MSGDKQRIFGHVNRTVFPESVPLQHLLNDIVKSMSTDLLLCTKLLSASLLNVKCIYLTFKRTGNIHSGGKRKRTLDLFGNSKSPSLTPEATLLPVSGPPSNLNHKVHKKYASKLNNSTSQTNRTLFSENMCMNDNNSYDAGSYTL